MPIADDVVLGKDVRIFQPDLVNLYGCTIGAESKIGAFVEVQKNVQIGARCKISSLRSLVGNAPPWLAFAVR